MYQKPTVPRSIGGVLDDCLQLYKASLTKCMVLALLASFVAGAMSYFVLGSMPVITPTTPLPPAEVLARYQGMFATFGVWYLLVIVVSAVLYGAMIVTVTGVSHGEAPPLGAALAKGVRRAPALILAGIVFVISITIGFVLLLIPGFYLWNRMQLFAVPLVAESTGPFESIGTSWRLVGGNWWRTATLVFVIFVIILIFEIIIGTVGGAVAYLSGATSGLTVNPASLARVSLVTMLIGGLVRIFTLPLVIAAFVAIYQDLVLRKGGGDLEARLGALPKT
jgi:hypothetical protein